MAPIHTIGHSVTPVERFIELLHEAEIETLVDVRSVPYSRRVPHANRESLQRTIEGASMEYVYLGDRLGGKVDDPKLKTPDGKTDYHLVRTTDSFRAGIEHLIAIALERSTCIMCAEENPAHCHRTALITPALIECGCDVVHLRHDGSQQTQSELQQAQSNGQLSLF